MAAVEVAAAGAAASSKVFRCRITVESALRPNAPIASRVECSKWVSKLIASDAERRPVREMNWRGRCARASSSTTARRQRSAFRRMRGRIVRESSTCWLLKPSRLNARACGRAQEPQVKIAAQARASIANVNGSVWEAARCAFRFNKSAMRATAATYATQTTRSVCNRRTAGVPFAR